MLWINIHGRYKLLIISVRGYTIDSIRLFMFLSTGALSYVLVVDESGNFNETEALNIVAQDSTHMEKVGTFAEMMDLIPTFLDKICQTSGWLLLTLSGLNLPLSSSSTTSRELLSQFSTCSGWRWPEVVWKLKKLPFISKPVSWEFPF